MKLDIIKTILVPVDFMESSQRSIVEGAKLAKLFKAELILLHVLEMNSSLYPILDGEDMQHLSVSDLKIFLEHQIKKTGSRLNSRYGIKPRVEVRAGSIASEILSFSKKIKADLIVMGAHGHSGYKEWLIGSNAQTIVDQASVPVLTISSNYNKTGFRKILIPIDNSIHSREKVNIAMRFAELFDAEIHIVGLPDTDDDMELNKFYTKIASVEKHIDSDNLTYKTSILQGKNLATVAINYAVSKSCDLIVINTGHESRLKEVFLGAFSEQIVNHSSVPVLSLKHSYDHYTIETPGFGV